MSSNALNDVLTLDCESRYDVFLSMVAETREVWILVNDQQEFLLIEADDGEQYVPIWPSADLAQPYINDSTQPLTAKSLSLPLFLNRWITGLANDELSIGVLPKLGDDVWITSPAELKRDIQDEIDQH